MRDATAVSAGPTSSSVVYRPDGIMPEVVEYARRFFGRRGQRPFVGPLWAASGPPSLQRVEEGGVDFKLILALSMFGLLMGVATASVIPPSIEPAFWQVVFVVCAFFIGRTQVVMMLIVGPLIGIVSGCALGVLALIGSRLFRPKTALIPPAG
jgi:hypothetical protein